MGLRRGEVLGLRWHDVSLEPPVPQLRIRQTRVIVAGKDVVVSEPKTTRGRRTLPLDPHVVAAFTEYRERRESEERSWVVPSSPADHVVVDELGQPIAPDATATCSSELACAQGYARSACTTPGTPR